MGNQFEQHHEACESQACLVGKELEEAQACEHEDCADVQKLQEVCEEDVACKREKKVCEADAACKHVDKENQENTPQLQPSAEDARSDLSTEIGSELSSREPVESADPPEESVTTKNVFSAEETLMIFDWDDTLLPSTWVKQQGLSLDDSFTLTQEQIAKLQLAAKGARRTLLAAKQRGCVIIVTNGEQGWVELSCWKFMPLLYPVLEGLSIISARSVYEKQGITSPFEWKVRAFQHEVDNFYADRGPEGRRNVISLGDSMHEHMALITVTQGVPQCRAKSLKFVSFPELMQIVEQHELLSGCMDDIVDHDGDLNLEVLVS
eukprot:CAMPEP_0172720188 /NCGR_PEP_ID=MMETSP1074-20121228/76353_1 /TAXON_ID=2916 /ORGANISM="Ceratium fusus, Strain PA161109" /LENGTH=320 /DNA_ID=CAMNT_0013545659 /DNA_START=76 /DNA_END=1038 /DNA_ORIENTATION=+